ncbi:phosphoenolpyruvate--protein phosphotransferase [Salisaeta longa]|uniref:phosphoenolpyruvate--protein phosphotransferase n=1 Tax=Salisaeta longa TaxID=503170 RepID=UPI0003B4BEC8|nr:phosphoenolpyruvate--protein phosphotransferase [Salisaeta longa]
MLHLVLVSHSRPLAERLVDFVRQMAGDDVPISIAAGTDDGVAFGTDATAIVAAITDGPPDAETLLLVDVGSAVLSAELALDLLPDAVRSRVRLCPAPFVEGTLSAAVQASVGANLDAAYREAVGALQQKVAAVAEATGDTVPDDTAPEDAAAAAPTDATRTVEVTLPNPHGLHARPAAQLIRTASTFDATIRIENRTARRGPVSARSVSSVMMLGAGHNDRLRLSAEGPQAEAALSALADLIREGFGELEAPRDAAPDPSTAEEPAAPASATGPEATIVGQPVAGGIALGPIYQQRATRPDLPDTPPDAPEAAWSDLQDALDTVAKQMDAEQSEMAAAGMHDAAAILDAQALLLADEALRRRVRRAIVEAHRPAARAWMEAVTALAEEYAAMDDAYLQQRADDVRDVGHRVVRHLLGEAPAPIDPGEPFILVARSLAPSDVPALQDRPVRGILCAQGNATSHSAILLRSQGLPAVFGAGADVLAIPDGTRVALRGDTGAVWIDPSSEIERDLRGQQSAAEEARAERVSAAHAPAHTPDGPRVFVTANVNRPADAATAAAMGADGVGLLRTEFLFTGRNDPPSADEQVGALNDVATRLGGKPVVVRALDVGGDKPLPYVPLPPEANPFLGLRGIRVLLQMPSLFQSQLRAILRVAATHDVSLMLPMVAVPSEIEQTRAALHAARDDLQRAGVPAADALPLGMMIETPASALAAARFAAHVDFFSIGTNDLTQYTMAADREHDGLQSLSDALHPPVLSLIDQVATAAREASGPLPVSVCGELAAQPAAVPLLLGLGIERLSVAPPAVPLVKAIVRHCPRDPARALAHEALAARDAADVHALCRAFLEDTVGLDAGPGGTARRA